MQFTKAGIILNTGRYADCVDFYGRVLGLEMLHQIDRPGERLATFDLGGVYLMIEGDGTASDHPKTIEVCPTKIRFNVPDVEAAGAQLKKMGVAIEVVRHSWGITAEFCDPDGNRCALRSDDGFGE